MFGVVNVTPAAYAALEPTGTAVAAGGSGAVAGGSVGGAVLALRALRRPLTDVTDRLNADRRIQYAAVARDGVAPVDEPLAAAAPGPADELHLPGTRPEDVRSIPLSN